MQVPLAYLPELSAAGLLKPLDAWMKRDKVSDDSWQSAVKQTLREAGGGQLYGYAPEFTGHALYYNRKLFREYGIPEPTEGMTWEEVMNLAIKFDGVQKKRKAGLRPELRLQHDSVARSRRHRRRPGAALCGRFAEPSRDRYAGVDDLVDEAGGGTPRRLDQR
ncbi:extracellular solute-binding protein [Cohnella ginsengisoli]|uniref:Extracellular solute-binding protein n=1 Tax=Cohnella ginsengisoli TaxID=425004 RepID=A0A9X4KLG8_9BACL|nr:extracellular solute-binding protein [Cohnella ginsengisoli]MDG0794444.1 extracellular solute-binding protein [Cohnella ginsengisoli]